jgi:hypothetical protein
MITKIFRPWLPTIPDPEFILALFSERAPRALQMHVVEHVAHWLSKTVCVDDWTELFRVHPEFGTEMALANVRRQSQENPLPHPSHQDRFAERHGLNLAAWVEKAGEGDASDAESQVEELLIAEPSESSTRPLADGAD